MRSFLSRSRGSEAIDRPCWGRQCLLEKAISAVVDVLVGLRCGGGGIAVAHLGRDIVRASFIASESERLQLCHREGILEGKCRRNYPMVQEAASEEMRDESSSFP